MGLLYHVDRKLTIPAWDQRTCLYLILRLIRISVLLINASTALFSEIGVARKNWDHLSSRYTRWEHITLFSMTYYWIFSNKLFIGGLRATAALFAL